MPWRFGLVGVIVWLASGAGTAGAQTVAADTYPVGTAVQDITPDYPIRLSGFGFRRDESEGVTAPIFARALAIGSDADGPAVLLTVDTTGVSDAVVQELARRLAPRGVKPERLAVSGTHTHTAPMLAGVLPTLFGQPVPRDHQAHIDQYTREFTDHLEQVAVAALSARQPAKLFWGVGEVGIAKNRRNPQGPIDHSLPVLAVKSLDGRLRAVLTTYACHAVTLSHNFIGGDWPGFAAESIERLHPGVVAMISIGCGADQNPISGVTGDKVDVARMQGLELATEVDRVLKGALRPVAGMLSATLSRIELPLAELPPRSHWESLVPKGGYIGYHAQVQLATLDRGEALPTQISYPVQTWTFGDSLGMVFLPGEVVVDYAHRLRKELDGERLWITAYANDTPCYIPSERVLAEGGYEGAAAMTYYNWPAKFQPGVEQRIVDEVLRQMPAGYRSQKQAAADRPPPAAVSQEKLNIPDELLVELVAAEPLTTDPVAIDFGPDGRLWVCEMHDYPSGLHGNFEPGGRVRILRDDDGDGIYDRSTVFLDGLPFPTGVTVWRNGVLICAAPDIIYAEDTNGDDVADIRRVLFTGFGTENYQARVNSLTYGLDGWVYGSCGLFGGNIRSEITGETVALGNRDFRIDPDRGVLEPISGRTQQGRVRNDDGDWFGCSNSQPMYHYPFLEDATRPGLTPPPLVVQVPAGPDPLQMYPRLAEYQRFKLSGPAGRVTAACGLGLYRDDWLGSGYVNNAVVCESVNLLLHRRVLERRGVTFAGHRVSGEEQTELLTSTDNWFRPVQVRTGPDGGLWFVDMCRAVIEHPRWIPEDVRATLDVRAGDRQGRIYRLLPRDRGPRPVPRLDAMTSAELVDALRSANGTVRDLAQQLLLWRDDRSVVPQLQQLAVHDASVSTRIAALWTLARWEALTWDEIEPAIRSNQPRLRRQLVEIHAASIDPLLAVGALLVTLRKESDPTVILAMTDLWRRRPNLAKPDWLAELYDKHFADPWLRFAILRAVPEADWPAFAVKLMANSELSRLEPILAISLAEKHPAAIALLLERLLPASPSEPPASWRMLEQVLVARQRQPKLLADDVLTAAQSERLESALASARRVFVAPETTDAVRAEVAGLVGLSSDDDVVALLLARLTPQSSPALQARIIAALDRMGRPDLPDQWLARWNGLGPAARNDVLDRLLSRPAGAKTVLAALSDGRLPPGTLDAARRQVVLQHRDTGVRELAARVLQAEGMTSRGAVLAAHRTVLSLTGDAARGREVFAKRCAVCHQWDGQGHAVGPDLGESRNKNWSALLESILDPNRAVDQRYAVYTAITVDGRSVQGLVAAENDTSVTLKAQEAKLTTLPRSEIEEFGSTGRSLMPEGIERDLSPQDFADVFALVTGRSESGEAERPSPTDVARQVLDDAMPRAEREALVAANVDRAGELIAAMAEGLGNDLDEEYRRIPWIWRVAVAAGKQNRAETLRNVLRTSLPQPNAPLADWQAVVIGGGVINGITLAGGWPHERVAELIGNDRNLRSRWQQALEASVAMADDEKVRHGTRYDALRMLPLLGWNRSGPQLVRYLAKDTPAELQMGAVSGAADVPEPQAATALIEHLPGLTPRNRDLALDGLLRSEARMLLLLEAVAAGRVTMEQLGPQRIERLRMGPTDAVREKAAAVLPKE
jgi:putative membrane-bound dehydrogenase-like protein